MLKQDRTNLSCNLLAAPESRSFQAMIPNSPTRVLAKGIYVTSLEGTLRNCIRPKCSEACAETVLQLVLIAHQAHEY